MVTAWRVGISAGRRRRRNPRDLDRILQERPQHPYGAPLNAPAQPIVLAPLLPSLHQPWMTTARMSSPATTARAATIRQCRRRSSAWGTLVTPFARRGTAQELRREVSVLRCPARGCYRRPRSPATTRPTRTTDLPCASLCGSFGDTGESATAADGPSGARRRTLSHRSSSPQKEPNCGLQQADSARAQRTGAELKSPAPRCAHHGSGLQFRGSPDSVWRRGQHLYPQGFRLRAAW
ncbi:hypothetical protein SAMN05444920_1563 [Nonomuraea solani]|uniref:Uncharacterized protein n=1 Tax=Nonomuraea solani TaxID=1144553 RepID=A0A1H6F3V8_9ACTN|nr:hypothetical protein SAMN05444920_1563 [Nonomuraea solani]